MFEAERRQLIAALPMPMTKAFIAGGAITSIFTNAKINDVDVYFKSKEAFEYNVFQAYEEGLWCVAATKRAVTFADRSDNIVQMMHFGFFPTAADIFAAFYFSVCMGAYDCDAPGLTSNLLGLSLDADEVPANNGFILHDDFLKHNSQRFLRFNPGTRYPLASAARVLKYQQRGYTIGKGDIMKIALAVRGVKLDCWEDLKDQIGGAYGEKVVIGNEDTPFSIDAAIEALTVDAAELEPWIKPDNDDTAGNAEALLRLIARKKGEEYVPGARDEDGWPLAA